MFTTLVVVALLASLAVIAVRRLRRRQVYPPTLPPIQEASASLQSLSMPLTGFSQTASIIPPVVPPAPRLTPAGVRTVDGRRYERINETDSYRPTTGVAEVLTWSQLWVRLSPTTQAIYADFAPPPEAEPENEAPRPSRSGTGR